MTFKPKNTKISAEKFEDRDILEFSLSSGQTLRGGRLIVYGTPVYKNKVDMAFEKVDWGQTSDFLAVPDRRQPGAMWNYATDVPALTSDEANGLFPFYGSYIGGEYVFYENKEPSYEELNNPEKSRVSYPNFQDKETYNEKYSRYGIYGKELQGRRPLEITGRDLLSLAAEDGEENYIYQATGKYWDNVNNQRGYTIEFKAMVPEGTSEIVLDDGARRIALKLTPQGIFESSELRLPVEWKDLFRKVRVSARGDDLFILDENGYGYAGTSSLGPDYHASDTKELLVGQLGNAPGWLLLDYLNQSANGVYVSIEDDVDYTYETAEQIAITPELKHRRVTAGWGSAVYSSPGPFGSGTTKIRPQYNNSSVGAWTNHGAYVTLNNERTVIDLSGIPMIQDSSDSLRFMISQTCASTSERCADVDEIIVGSRFPPVKYDLIEEYGPQEGGNEVRIRAVGNRAFLQTDIVYLGDTAIPTSDIDFGTSEISFDSPGGDPGLYAVSVYDSATSEYFTDEAYKLEPNYDKVDSRYERDGSPYKRSFFSIVDRVENGSLPLSHITADALDSKDYAKQLDISYLHPSNNNGVNREILIQSANTSENEFVYTNDLINDETVVGGYTAVWDDIKVPSQLYYMALAGRGRYLLKSKTTTPTDKEIRDQISLVYSNGEKVDVNDFPWDIVISNQSVLGADLPSGTYSIVIFTREKSIPGKTIYVKFDAVDIANAYSNVLGYKEILNVEKIYGSTGDYSKEIYSDETGATHLRITINE